MEVTGREKRAPSHTCQACLGRNTGIIDCQWPEIAAAALADGDGLIPSPCRCSTRSRSSSHSTRLRLHVRLGPLVCNAAPLEIPARFLIDAATLRFSTGETLAAAAAHHDNSASTGGTTLGRGCFGFVRSMTCNGAPVAVKELSGGSLDDTSIGEVFLNRRFLRAPACTRRGGSLDRHRPAPSPFCRFYSPVLAVLLQTMSWRS